MNSKSFDIQDYLARLREHSLKRRPDAAYVTPIPRVVELAQKIGVWHGDRPVPDRWQPILLGRVAALFGVSRDLAAAALLHAGWKETRRWPGGPSYWHPPSK